MSSHGANGNGNGTVENPVDNPVMMPGRNGGQLKRGGTLSPGRPRKEVRNMLLNEFVSQIPKLKREIGKKGKVTRKEYTELCGRFSLGTTVTETDTEGNDAPRPQVVVYIPENGRISTR